MTYQRVLPRDAFNEANLLKCVARLTLLIEDRMAPGWEYGYSGKPFEIYQNPDDGSIYVVNIRFKFNGQKVHLWRPLNSRELWPLLLEDTEVFNPDGDLIIKAKTTPT